jgi:hypothetical protein
LIAKSLHGVRQLQLVQHALDRITIRFVPSEDFRGSADVELLVDSFSKAVAESVDWQTEAVEQIPRTAGGKFMSVVSHLAPIASYETLLEKPSQSQESVMS